MSGSDVHYAAADVRDKFLVAIDSGDWQACMRLALGLTTCGNPLPGLACHQLDLPARSTYGCAARRVLAICRGSLTGSPASSYAAVPPGASEAGATPERAGPTAAPAMGSHEGKPHGS